MTETEKRMITKAHASDNGTEAQPQNIKQSTATFKSLFCRIYLAAFCIYVIGYNLIFYNLFSVVPFFLNEVLGIEPLLISYLNIGLSILIAFSTLTSSFVYRKLDKKLAWLTCRMLFTLLPMIIQILLLVALSQCSSISSKLLKSPIIRTHSSLGFLYSF